MPERATELAAALADTERAVTDLSKAVDVHQSTLRRVKVVFAVGMFGLILDLTLTVLVGWGLVGVNHNQDRINSLQTAMQVETDRNRQAQCAFISLFLQFAPRTTTNPTYTEEQRAQQVRAYNTLKQIGHDLGCAGL